MDEPEVKYEHLKKSIKSLYGKAGQLNLYLCRCNSKSFPDIERLKLAIENIKRVLLDIENEIHRI